MLPFAIELKPGLPLAEQVVFAVKRAVASGELKPGTPFPSVRALSLELKINPNTAHKVIAALVADGVLVTTPAVGSVVAEPAPGGARAGRALLAGDFERLAVEAKHLGLTLDEAQAELAAHWRRLGRK